VDHCRITVNLQLAKISLHISKGHRNPGHKLLNLKAVEISILLCENVTTEIICLILEIVTQPTEQKIGNDVNNKDFNSNNIRGDSISSSHQISSSINDSSRIRQLNHSNPVTGNL
jgi:hypothetical protein